MSMTLVSLSVPAPQQASRRRWLRIAGKNLLMVPVAPMIGYLLFDATGVTAAIAGMNPVLHQILGEGFGHVGLCYSAHNVLTAGKAFFRAFQV